MAIPSVVQGLIEVKGGKVFELDSPKGATWLESIGSFRFEPTGDSKACTIRREPSGYWYGCRKVAGKVRKKYIGKTSELSTARLEEVAEALEVPPAARASKVAEVAQEVTQNIQVAEKVAEDRLTALELEVASLRKALEALQEALPGKSEAGNCEELPKVDNALAEKLPKADNEVVEKLQNELSNLKAENEYVRQKFAESRDTVETLNWGTEALNEQLEAAQAENQRLQNNLGNSQAEVTELRSQLKQERADREKQIEKLRSELATQTEPTPQHKLYAEIEGLRERNRLLVIKSREERQALQEKISALEYRDKSQSRRLAEKQNRLDELEEIEAQLSSLKQKSVAASELPEAADLLNQLKTRRKKSTATLADIEAILEMIEES
jgi:DNA repair exonuclease SbcCD ATPase subunit